MSVKTSVSSTAQSLSTRPGMLSGPGALRALILLRDLLTLFGDSDITWSPGGGGVGDGPIQVEVEMDQYRF